MAPSINIDVAELAGLIVESILYGIFLVLFVAAMYFTFARRRGIGLNKVMVLSALVLFVLATTQLVADATNIFQAFISRTREERISFLQDVSQPLFILKHTTLILMRLVSDFFVTYRCWIVWNNNIWVVITPIALTLGSGVVGFHTIWSFQHYGRETRAAQEQWLIALSVLSLAANAIATAFTALRIWNTGRRTVAEPPAPSLIPVVVIIIESSALNAAYMIANTITLITGNEGLETMAELVCAPNDLPTRMLINTLAGNTLSGLHLHACDNTRVDECHTGQQLDDEH
ncbi:hypothetical protein NEOLEDRAFT_1171772 [Neolentinus lepideus HHB14362 ss-1]|uniref:Uncharacterized protein n=1 Tax=Neolentinus lepideus HHB14362 ss-1 TaxID=1314782 RepID=A0A165Q110_9AGAM|nr:hypothetical protein NEOLEDRAFT_1171772 [Neolentinus lepideus HHB14362 ss-1]